MIGKKPAITVVAKAELAQSYKAQEIVAFLLSRWSVIFSVTPITLLFSHASALRNRRTIMSLGRHISVEPAPRRSRQNRRPSAASSASAAVEQQRIVPTYLRQCLRLLFTDESLASEIAQSEQRQHRGQRLVRAIEHTRMPVLTPPHLAQKTRGPIDLCDARDVAIQIVLIAWLIHHACEQHKVFAARTVPPDPI